MIIYPIWEGDKYKNRTNIDVRLDMLFAAFEKHPNSIVTRLCPIELQDVLMTSSKGDSMETKISGVSYIGLIGSDTVANPLIPENARKEMMRGTKISSEDSSNTRGCFMIFPIESFIIGKRINDSEEDLKNLGGQFGGRRILGIVPTQFDSVSSTEIRERLKNGKSIDKLINPNVKSVIETRQLYR